MTINMKTHCDHADNGPCVAGHGTFNPDDTDLSLCRRHYNTWKQQNGISIPKMTRPRYPDGEAIPGFDRELVIDQ